MTPELIERARGGDAAALEVLLTELAPAIMRFGRRMCGHPADADDVVQDTLLAISQHLGEFEGRSSLSSWAFSLTRSACSRRRRGLKNQPLLPLDPGEEESRSDLSTPESDIVDRQLSSLVDKALSDLSDEHREVILLRDVEGLTAPEAADSLGITIEALKSRLHRARGALRRSLAPALEQNIPAPGPSCPDVLSLWSRKLEGDLNPGDCSAMEQHLLGCQTCAGACDALKRSLSACSNLGGEAVPEALKTQIRAALTAFQPRSG